MKSVLGRLGGLVAMVVLAACSQGGLTPTAPLPAPAGPSGTSSVTAADYAAAISVSSFTYHVMPLRTRPLVPSRSVIFPADLNFYGGPRMKAEKAINIYVNCKTHDQKCWGAPEAFQTSLAGSSFAGMLRQYTGSEPARYTFGSGTSVAYPVFSGILGQNDLLTIVHKVAVANKPNGYGKLYHIFLPKGTDTCFDASSSCYSPNYPSTMAFCAYHAAAVFKDIGLVIYTVEPYQDIAGCKTKKSAGASELTNSTISTLAHETFESITDPGPPLAWYNFQFGEIGDICEFFVSQVTLGKLVYNTQPMYSNKYHACATTP